jgi:hypothetical protein
MSAMGSGMNYSTFICAGTVVLVADELSMSDRQDGLDALLYAQTVATRKVPDFAEFESWAYANKMAVRTLGGMLLNDSHISLPALLYGSFALEDLALLVLRQWLPAAAIKAMEDNLSTLAQQASDTVASDLLRTHALQQETRVQFKFGVMSDDLSIDVAAIAFEYDEAIAGHLLSHRFSHEKVLGNVSICALKAQLESEDYELSRATVISLLGARRQEQIIQLS